MNYLFPYYEPYTRKEEHKVFLVIRAGEAAEKEMNRYGLSEEEKEKLSATVEKGKEAREDMFLHNTNLACDYVLKYCSNFLGVRPDCYDDLFMTALLGVNRAIDLFDVDSGYKFSTYAYQWMKKYVNEYVYRESYLLKYHRNMYILINKYRDFCCEYEQYTGDIPDDQTIMHELNIKPEKLYYIKDAIEGHYDLDFDIDDDLTFGETVDSGLNVERSVEQDLLIEEVKKRMDVLTPVEKFFVQLYYGIGIAKRSRLCDVEKMFGYRKGAGKEILQKAYKKLRPYFDPSMIDSVCHA